MAQTQPRQNYHAESEAGINKQINLELYASYCYQSMVSRPILGLIIIIIIQINVLYSQQTLSIVKCLSQKALPHVTITISWRCSRYLCSHCRRWNVDDIFDDIVTCGMALRVVTLHKWKKSKIEIKNKICEYDIQYLVSSFARHIPWTN